MLPFYGYFTSKDRIFVFFKKKEEKKNGKQKPVTFVSKVVPGTLCIYEELFAVDSKLVPMSLLKKINK